MWTACSKTHTLEQDGARWSCDTDPETEIDDLDPEDTDHFHYSGITTIKH